MHCGWWLCSSAFRNSPLFASHSVLYCCSGRHVLSVHTNSNCRLKPELGVELVKSPPLGLLRFTLYPTSRYSSLIKLNSTSLFRIIVHGRSAFWVDDTRRTQHHWRKQHQRPDGIYRVSHKQEFTPL